MRAGQRMSRQMEGPLNAQSRTQSVKFSEVVAGRRFLCTKLRYLPAPSSRRPDHLARQILFEEQAIGGAAAPRYKERVRDRPPGVC